MLIGMFGRNSYGPLEKSDAGGGSGGSGASASGASGNGTNGADDESNVADLEDDDGEEGEDEDDDPDKASAEASFTQMMRRYNNNTRDAALALFRDNWKQRQRVRLLRDENTELRAATKLGKNKVVVPRQDAQELQEWRRLGAKPSEVKQGLEERSTLAERLSTTERETKLREVVDATGWNLAPLKRVIGNLDVETVAEDDGKGQKIPVAYVLTTKQVGGKDTVERTKITDYADREWSDMLPALTAASTSGGGGRSTATNQSTGNQQNGGRRMVRQGVGAGANASASNTRKPGQISADYTQRTYVVPGAKRDDNK